MEELPEELSSVDRIVTEGLDNIGELNPSPVEQTPNKPSFRKRCFNAVSALRPKTRQQAMNLGINSTLFLSCVFGIAACTNQAPSGEKAPASTPAQRKETPKSSVNPIERAGQERKEAGEKKGGKFNPDI